MQIVPLFRYFLAVCETCPALRNHKRSRFRLTQLWTCCWALQNWSVYVASSFLDCAQAQSRMILPTQIARWQPRKERQ